MFKWKSFKLLLIGGIVGILMTGTSVYGSQQVKEFILKKGEYPIMTGDKEYKSEALPILNYEGTTYVPLKAMGDLLHIPVKWNAEKKQVELPDMSSTGTSTSAAVELKSK